MQVETVSSRPHSAQFWVESEERERRDVRLPHTATELQSYKVTRHTGPRGPLDLVQDLETVPLVSGWWRRLGAE